MLFLRDGVVVFPLFRQELEIRLSMNDELKDRLDKMEGRLLHMWRYL